MEQWEVEHLKKTLCTMRKHKGKSWWDVCAQDARYAKWAAENAIEDEELQDAILWGVRNVPEKV